MFEKYTSNIKIFDFILMWYTGDMFDPPLDTLSKIG